MTQNAETKAATPRDAAAIILLNAERSKLLWAQRNLKLRFLGGFHGFPGGKVDTDDSAADVRNCADAEQAKMIACAVREVFEEVGVLLIRNGEKLTDGQRKSLHDDLISGRFKFSDILKTWGLWIDAADFQYTGIWTTPEFSPIRFRTHFFVAVCPPKQTPYAAITELQKIEFIDPSVALEQWSNSKVLIAPPVLIAFREFADCFATSENDSKATQNELGQVIKTTVQNLLYSSNECGGDIEFIELNSRLICLPLRTKTLPPATHTNCFIVGGKKFVVIDAATKETSEQQKLFDLVDGFIEKGFVFREIIVSHLHADHFGGETALQSHVFEKFGQKIPISGHKITAKSLEGKVAFDRFIVDEESIGLKNFAGEAFEFTALHTPGHARGHLCFYDREFGFLLSSDNVVGLGSVLIALPEGDMTDYLKSLERMKNLPNLNFLSGSHGSAIADAKSKIDEYISHRIDRENQIIEAISSGAESTEEITKIVYKDLKPELFPLAVESVRAHLAKIRKSD